MPRTAIESEVTGKVWKIAAEVGTTLSADDTILVVESMKMEIPVVAPSGGRLVEVRVQEGEAVETGQVVAVLER